MPEYRRPRHRTVARVLQALDARFLEQTRCYFGGGTRIALELGEYRESEDIDFLCSDLAGYRELRAGIDDRSPGRLMPALPLGISLLRDIRADQYGIRTVFAVDGQPVKFEIILEARIAVSATTIKRIPVPVLDRISCFAEKWMANADRWNDKAVLSRDAIDLAFMLRAWPLEDALAGAKLAINAYGNVVARSALKASIGLLEDARHRKHCVDNLAITDTKSMMAGLKALAQISKKTGLAQ